MVANAANDCQVVVKCRRRYQGVEIADELVSFAKIASDLGKATHDLDVESMNRDPFKRRRKGHLISRTMPTVPDAFVDLAERRNTDCQAIGREST